MSHTQRLGPTEIIPPLVAVTGTIVWITIDGFTGESIAQALTTLCTMFVILIPIYRHILKKPKDTHLESGSRACHDIQRKHALILCGPKFRKDNYVPDSQHTDHQYLFIQKPDSRRKAALIAISPFKKAIAEISFSRTTMEILGINGEFETRKQQLHDALLHCAEKHYKNLFSVKKMEKYENICIVLDFDIERVSVKMFRQVIGRLLEEAMGVMGAMRTEAAKK